MHKNRLEGYSVNKIAFFYSFTNCFIERSGFNPKIIETESVHLFLLQENNFWLALDLYVHFTNEL